MLKLSRRDFRPAVNKLLAGAYLLGLPADQRADHNASIPHEIPTLKPPNMDDVYGLSAMEIETVLKRRSSISQDTQALPDYHDSDTMPHIEPSLEFITDPFMDLPDVPQMQLQPESNTESWQNLQLAPSLQAGSDHNPSIFALPQTAPLQYQPQSFHQTPNLPLDAGHPPREANGPMGPDSHMLESDTHNHAGFGYGIFHTSTDYHGAAPWSEEFDGYLIPNQSVLAGIADSAPLIHETFCDYISAVILIFSNVGSNELMHVGIAWGWARKVVVSRWNKLDLQDLDLSLALEDSWTIGTNSRRMKGRKTVASLGQRHFVSWAPCLEFGFDGLQHATIPPSSSHILSRIQ
jgi:hypothetical protein